LLLAGAGKLGDALREGNSAYLSGDYESAVRYYEAALLVTDDPGLISFNQGSALAAAGRPAQAALAFRRCLEDAAGLRRVKAAYGHGTMLTAAAANIQGQRAVAALRQAIASLEVASREAEALAGEAEPWRADALHNRTIAEALLAKKLKEPEPPGRQDDRIDPLEALQGAEQEGPGRPANPQPSQPRVRQETGDGTGEAISTSQTQPGKGRLPTRLDDQETPPLTREEALARLQRAMNRLQKPLGPTVSRPGVKDW
jgi:tetratricopeptide (TPR) repeat protein